MASMVWKAKNKIKSINANIIVYNILFNNLILFLNIFYNLHSSLNNIYDRFQQF